MPLVTIVLQTADDAKVMEGTKNIYDSVHEALCKAIHEGNTDALNWLTDNIVDVGGQ
jgi:hypothetical protein